MRPAPPPAAQAEEEALELVDGTFSLINTIVSVASGPSAMTDCGLVPAMSSFISTDTEKKGTDVSVYAETLREYILAQAIAILEQATVVNTTAFSVFNDVNGLDLLVDRLCREVEQCESWFNYEAETEGTRKMSVDAAEVEIEAVASTVIITRKTHRALGPTRGVLCSIINCITVVLQQLGASTAGGGGTQLQKPGLTSAARFIMDNAGEFGVLVPLVLTLLSDVMNNEPQVVPYVHSSGLATSFINMLGRSDVPTSNELIMVLPNVLSALSLHSTGGG